MGFRAICLLFHVKKPLILFRSHFHFVIFFFSLSCLVPLSDLLPTHSYAQPTSLGVRSFQCNHDLKPCPFLVPTLLVQLYGISVLPILPVFQACQLSGGRTRCLPDALACGSPTHPLPYPVLMRMIKYSPFFFLCLFLL